MRPKHLRGQQHYTVSRGQPRSILDEDNGPTWLWQEGKYPVRPERFRSDLFNPLNRTIALKWLRDFKAKATKHRKARVRHAAKHWPLFWQWVSFFKEMHKENNKVGRIEHKILAYLFIAWGRFRFDAIKTDPQYLPR